MSGEACNATPGCKGHIDDTGYCDKCGQELAVAAAPAASGAAASLAAAPAATPKAGDPCNATPGCKGHFDSTGYCDTCGLEPVVVAPAATSGTRAASGDSTKTNRTAGILSGKTGSANTGIAAATAAALATRRGTILTHSTSNQVMGEGYVEVKALPKTVPEKTIMPVPEVPVRKRFCSNENCKHHDVPMFDEALVAAGKQTAREKGFCLACGTPYNFKWSFKVGDMIQDQYKILGALAFGGMGWISLAVDTALNRYCVLKGLLNSDDENLAKAAVAERQFLAEIKHPNILQVYASLSWNKTAFIVTEFVGGKTYKQIRKERGQLPVAEVCAVIHRALGGLAKMHNIGLLHNDIKIDNFMQEEDDVKIIDLGAVRRIGQQGGDIFGTVGYQAPEVARDGVSVVSDLYSFARTAWILACEGKGNTTTNLNSFPSEDEEPVFAKYPAFHLWLLKCGHPRPDMRFQSAEEAQDQLLGVLRQVAAIDRGFNKPHESSNFQGDPLAFSNIEKRGLDSIDAEALPRLLLDKEDPSTSYIQANFSDDASKLAVMYEEAIKRFPDSAQAKIGRARAFILLGKYAEAEKLLAEVEKKNPYDFRVIWMRGASYLQQKDYANARAAFTTCWCETPGDLGGPIAIALASEANKEYDRSIVLYDLVSKTDPSFVTAAFGLARCRVNQGDRNLAIEALGRISQTSSLFGEAQKATALTLLETTPGSTPGADDLSKAAKVIESLALAGMEGYKLVADMFGTAVTLFEGKKIKPDPKVTLLGQRLDEKHVRLGLEKAYREMALLETDPAKKVALVDLANEVRPRTWI